MEDGRCKLGVAGRLQLVLLIEGGCSFRAAAAESSVSVATAHRWWRRWVEASEAERVSRACLRARPPVPRSCPWALGAEAEQAILRARARTNWGPMRLTALTGRHRSTIWKVLARHGVSRSRRSQPRQSTRRYEWTEAGALLHIDAFSLPKFERPGHWATGERAERCKTRRAGTVRVIGVIDDHTRLAYCELHAAETASAVSATLRRAAAWMTEQGCGPVQAVMSDNAKCYATSREFSDTLHELGARHILSRPTRRAGTARSNASSAPWTPNGHTAASGPPAATATAPWHPSPATTTAAGHTQPPAADHPSPAFSKTASRTSRAP